MLDFRSHFDSYSCRVSRNKEASNGYIATIDEFPDFYAEGFTHGEAEHNVQVKLNLHLDFLAENKIPAPESHSRLCNSFKNRASSASFPFALPRGTLSLPTELELAGLEFILGKIRDSDFSIIVCLTRGGRFVARYLKNRLVSNIEFRDLSYDQPKLWMRTDSDWSLVINDQTNSAYLQDQRRRTFEVNAIEKGLENMSRQKILVVDDLIASGATTEQALKLLSADNEVTIVSLARNTSQGLYSSFDILARVFETTNQSLQFSWSEHPLRIGTEMAP